MSFFKFAVERARSRHAPGPHQAPIRLRLGARSDFRLRWRKVRRALHTPHAAQPQRALLCEGAPLSREAVAQQDVRAGGPAPGAAS